MRSILHVIGFALCAISVAAVLLSISGFGILFPIGATLIFLGLFFKTKKQKTIAGDLVGSTPPSFSRPISSSYSPYHSVPSRRSTSSSSSSGSSSTSSSTRRDDTSYYDTSPFAYTSYTSSYSSSSDDSCSSSSSSYDSSSSSSSDSSSCGGSD